MNARNAVIGVTLASCLTVGGVGANAGTSITQREIDAAYTNAARAISIEGRQHSLYSVFLMNGMEYGMPVYEPGVFEGLEWYCDPLAGQFGDHEQCYMGKEWINGKPVYQMGP